MSQNSQYQSWTDEELVRALTVERDDFLPEALVAVEGELVRRGFELETLGRPDGPVQRRIELDAAKLTGVRGWLLVFIVVLLGNSLFASLSGASLLSQAGASPVIMIVGISWMVLGLYGCYAFILLVSRKAQAPKHASWWLMAGFVLGSLTLGLVYLATRELIFLPIYFVGTAFWFYYLENSKRVAATYRENPVKIRADEYG